MMERKPVDSDSTSPRVGEVVEAASDRFTVQCYQLYESPPLGAFVRTGVNAGAAHTYAIVSEVSTQALDPGRPVVARGEAEVTEDDVYRSNPQLARLLCTSFQALIVGHGDQSGLRQYLPELPPRIHAFVYSCSGDEVRAFAGSLDFLDLLLQTSARNRGIADEVVAACVRQIASRSEDSHGSLGDAGKALAGLLSGDLPRLNSILRRISP